MINDYQDDEIKGCFYVEELQLVENSDVYLIEKALRTNRNQVYVKWLGFGPEHNSWSSKNFPYSVLTLLLLVSFSTTSRFFIEIFSLL